MFIATLLKHLLKIITEDVKRILTSSCGSERFGADNADLVNRLAKLEARIATLAEAASLGDLCASAFGLASPAAVVAGPSARSSVASIEPPRRTFIVNDRTLKIHERWIDDDNVDFARARCGWRYNTCAHTISYSFSEVAWFHVCDRCMHDDRAELKRKQKGEDPESASD